ncbi:unnamed protein product [Phytophthora fragariaefolia]|uniref:Unnamed protein product n=1 Tax=Phytophthora fragariaefolia TaxID=1490495 RepID=A0A9W6YBK7_9STRA|nr:unnamed protein product [Phytophthora fragariaefolia]
MQQVPRIKFTRWWNNLGVFVLAAGGSATVDRIVRRDPATGEHAEVMCPRFVKDYLTSWADLMFTISSAFIGKFSYRVHTQLHTITKCTIQQVLVSAG